MKQDKRPAGAAVKKRRFFNRISRKLMLFVVLMSMVLLALVWLLSVKLLEPMYNRRVLADLNHAADVYSAIIEKYGKFESFDKSGGVHIPSDMMEEIMDNRGLLAGKCFEVAGTDCKVLLHLHQLQSDQCLLHPNPLSQLMEYSEPQWNSTAAVNLRATTFVLGDLNFTLPDSRILPGLESTSGTRQMVVCRNINNQYSLILSTDLERVGQAADVISAQMPIIAAVLLIVSIAGAYVFSRWFTKPISAISRAAREMARGNYKVRVTPQADDELGGTAAERIVQRSIFVHLCALRIGHIQRVAARDDGRGPCVFTPAVGLAVRHLLIGVAAVVLAQPAHALNARKAAKSHFAQCPGRVSVQNNEIISEQPRQRSRIPIAQHLAGCRHYLTRQFGAAGVSIGHAHGGQQAGKKRLLRIQLLHGRTFPRVQRVRRTGAVQYVHPQALLFEHTAAGQGIQIGLCTVQHLLIAILPNDAVAVEVIQVDGDARQIQRQCAQQLETREPAGFRKQ